MAYKRSKYLLISRQPFTSPSGRPVCLGYSARTARYIHLSPATADHLKSQTIDALDEATLRSLVRSEAVVPAEEDELAVVLGRLQASSAAPQARRISIMPTAYCNMACSYCGQEHVKGGFRHDRMSRMIDRVIAAIADPGSREVRITWFGGEPLMAMRTIVDMSGHFVPEAQRLRKKYVASVVTNGSLLDERKLALLHDECRVEWVEVTLDGPAAVHDRRRKMKNGRGTFDRLLNLLSTVIREDRFPELKFGIRVNIDLENEDHTSALIDTLIERGLGHPRVQLSLARVHSWGNDVSSVELAAQAYAEREPEWLRTAQSAGMEIPLLPAHPKETTCIATTRRGELIDPSGAIYSCSEHPLVPRDRDRGRIATVEVLGRGQPRPEGAFDGWYGELAERRWPCAGCPFLPVCGGSCPKLWHDGGQPCPSYKFNWETRLELAAAANGYRRQDSGQHV
ncbi:radical SAM protein [Nonomuraea sp. NPDC005650]|uniref:radical SAM/SPASM domain-containing protein n=1 Tax=Nonomuraea sp. NPDC005650 TaxID=3157045 RepID=UPI0033AB1366